MLSHRESRRSAEPDIASVAAAVADRVRARMLMTLLQGDELTASELASHGETSPQAATAHLAKLVTAGLLSVRSSGRSRLFRLANADVAHLLESLAAIAPPLKVVSLTQHSTMTRLREARTCYDHLAGRLGVAVTRGLLNQKAVVLREEAFEITSPGKRFFADLNIDIDSLQTQRRALSRQCMDWTEKVPHLAGSLGASLLSHALNSHWIKRHKEDRSLVLTPLGRDAFAETFAVRFNPEGRIVL
jgi:DNA-binding transcriptional ArsR family regulator